MPSNNFLLIITLEQYIAWLWLVSEFNKYHCSLNMLFYLLSFRLDSERTGFCFLSRFELLVFHYFYSSLKKEVSPGLRNHLTLPHTSFTLLFQTTRKDTCLGRLWNKRISWRERSLESRDSSNCVVLSTWLNQNINRACQYGPGDTRDTKQNSESAGSPIPHPH